MTDSTEKGLLVFVYRNADGSDSTNGGLSSKVTQAVLIGPGIPPVFSARPGLPALRLVKRTLLGAVYYHAEPDEDPRAGSHVGPMFGGNFVSSCDSRMPSPYPIPVHDRYETQAEYDLNFD
jgi:hypothetical protein